MQPSAANSDEPPRSFYPTPLEQETMPDRFVELKPSQAIAVEPKDSLGELDAPPDFFEETKKSAGSLVEQALPRIILWS